MNRSLKYIVLPFTFSLLALAAFAQKELPSEQVDVVKSFDAHLLETAKIDVSPGLPPLDTVTRKQTYNVITKTTDVEYLPPSIRPLAMRGDDNQKVYQGYLKLGPGLPASLYGEASYYLNSVKNLDFGIDFKHHSANNTKKVENQRFNRNHFGATGTYYFDQGFAVNGRLGYTRNTHHFYGYNTINEEFDSSYTFVPEEVRQRFSIFDIGASIFNGVRTEADFNYSAGFDYYILNDNYEARENGFVLKISGTKWFQGQHALRVNLTTDFTSFKTDGKQTLNNFFLNPSYAYHGDRFKAKIGVNIASHNDEFSFFPDIELSANIVEGILGAFIGAEGSLQKNTFRNLTDYNPYLESRVPVKNTHYNDFFGGIKGNIQGIDYNAQIGYKNTDDLALFLISDTLSPVVRFDPIYDTVSVFYIKGSLSAPLFKGFELVGTLSQNVFNPKREEKAWHLPSFSVNVAAKYTTPDQKARVTGEFFLENGVPYRDLKGEVKNLNALFDISAGLEYFFSENFGGFIMINNLANNKRQRWEYYPTFGLNALVGISARF